MNPKDSLVSPPRGWNSYDYYDTTVTEADVRRNAQYMAEHLLPYGYEYVVVDIQWYAHEAGTRRQEYQYIPFSTLEMDEYSRLLPDPSRFPSAKGGAGFGPLASYIHSLGLKFGIHIMRGIPRQAAHEHRRIFGSEKTADQIANPYSICGWNPDMYGVLPSEDGQKYYDSLVELYASWGVDFIKCDDICHTALYEDHFHGKKEIAMLSRAIQKVEAPIVLSLSPGPALVEEAWYYQTHGNMWRITDDFWDRWDLLKNMFWRCELWQDHVRAGSFPDCDMLPVGVVGKGFGAARSSNFNYEETRTMITLWCLFGSPLMIGSELPLLDEKTLSLLTNEDLLALNHSSYIPSQILRDENHAIWKVSNGSQTYVAMFSLGDTPMEISIPLSEISTKNQLTIHNLWTKDRCFVSERITEILPPHGCVIFGLEE